MSAWCCCCWRWCFIAIHCSTVWCVIEPRTYFRIRWFMNDMIYYAACTYRCFYWSILMIRLLVFHALQSIAMWPTAQLSLYSSWYWIFIHKHTYTHTHKPEGARKTKGQMSGIPKKMRNDYNEMNFSVNFSRLFSPLMVSLLLVFKLLSFCVWFVAQHRNYHCQTTTNVNFMSFIHKWHCKQILF